MKTELLIITALESELKREALPSGVEIVYTGIGKINAAITSIKAIHQYSPKRILNFGTVGKINPQLHGLLEIGKVIQRDMDAEPLAPRGSTPFCIRPQEYLSTGQFLCGSGDSFVTAQDPWLLSQGVDVVDMELFLAELSIDWKCASDICCVESICLCTRINQDEIALLNLAIIANPVKDASV